MHYTDCNRRYAFMQDEVTCSNEGPLEELPEMVQGEGAVLHLHIFIASNSGLHHVQIGQLELVQLLCKVPVGGIWLVIFHASKFAVWRQPAYDDQAC